MPTRFELGGELLQLNRLDFFSVKQRTPRAAYVDIEGGASQRGT